MQRQSLFRSVSKIGVGTSAVLVIIAGLLGAQAFVPIPPPVEGGEEVTLTGEIVGLFCYTRAGFSGLGHKTCSRKCAEGGNPIGFLDEQGELYTLMGDADYQGPHEVRDALISEINEIVTLTGTLVVQDNTQVIFVTNIEEQAGPPVPSL